MCARPNWHYDRYGDKEYVEHVLRYYQITNTGGSYPANGMQIPHYLQTDYGNIPYGGGSIASSGCGPTSFAMIASCLTGNTITPPDAVAWCGNSYYKPGVGTYWSYFQAAASHFGCGSVTQTSNANTVLQALSEAVRSSPLSGQDFSPAADTSSYSEVLRQTARYWSMIPMTVTQRTILTVNLI